MRSGTQQWLFAAATALTLATLFVGGTMSLMVALGSLIVLLASAGAVAGAAFVLTVGVFAGGSISNWLGFRGAGGIFALIIGSVIAGWYVLRDRSVFAHSGIPICWFAGTCGVLSVSFFHGPMSTYSRDKIVLFALMGIAGTLAYTLAFCAAKARLFELGLLYVAGAACDYVAQRETFPAFFATSILIPGNMRENATLMGGVGIHVAGIPQFAALGLVVALCGMHSRYVRRWQWVTFAFSAVAALLIVNSSGTRLPIVSMVAAIAVIYSLTRRGSSMSRVLPAIVIVSVMLVVGAGIAAGDERFTRPFKGGETFGDRVDRGMNWQAGWDLFLESPITGAGLGGYYIPGFFVAPGAEVYPHNIVLELLAETGLIGTLSIALPVIFGIVGKYRRRAWRVATARGDPLVPIIVFLLVGALVSWDLRQNVWTFSAIVGAWIRLRQCT